MLLIPDWRVPSPLLLSACMPARVRQPLLTCIQAVRVSRGSVSPSR